MKPMHSPRGQSLVPMMHNSSMLDTPSQDSVIVELTRRLAERDAELLSITKQKVTLENYFQSQHSMTVNATIGAGAEAYDTLLAHYAEREEQLQVATTGNRQLESSLMTLKSAVDNLEKKCTVKTLQLQDGKEKASIATAMLSKIEGENASNRSALLASKRVIEGLNNEKEEMIAKAKQTDKTVKELKNESITHKEFQKKMQKHVSVISEGEAIIVKLNDKNIMLKEEIEYLKKEMKNGKQKESHVIESKDVLLNMQRQQMEEQVDLIQIYERKFLAKNTNVPKILARADEGDRVWAKIEEREKESKKRDIHVSALHDENTCLQVDKKKLQAEVEELKQCFEMYNLKLAGTGDKVHMPWLLGQLRESVGLKERVIELEEIIENSGYTVQAAKAESDFKKKEHDVTQEMDKLARVIEMLNYQSEGADDIELAALLGKLEEALRVFGYDGEIEGGARENGFIGDLDVSDSSELQSLNTNESYNHEEWVQSPCLSPRDFKGMMHSDHYNICTSLAIGLENLNGDGLCTGFNQDDVDEEDNEDEDFEDVFSDTKSGEYDKALTSRENAPSDAQEEGLRQREGAKRVIDIHEEKVLKIIAQDEDDPEDWRTWVDPVCSPCSTVAAE